MAAPRHTRFRAVVTPSVARAASAASAAPSSTITTDSRLIADADTGPPEGDTATSSELGSGGSEHDSGGSAVVPGVAFTSSHSAASLPHTVYPPLPSVTPTAYEYFAAAAARDGGDLPLRTARRAGSAREGTHAPKSTLPVPASATSAGPPQTGPQRRSLQPLSPLSPMSPMGRVASADSSHGSMSSVSFVRLPDTSTSASLGPQQPPPPRLLAPPDTPLSVASRRWQSERCPSASSSEEEGSSPQDGDGANGTPWSGGGTNPAQCVTLDELPRLGPVWFQSPAPASPDATNEAGDAVLIGTACAPFGHRRSISDGSPMLARNRSAVVTQVMLTSPASALATAAPAAVASPRAIAIVRAASAAPVPTPPRLVASPTPGSPPAYLSSSASVEGAPSSMVIPEGNGAQIPAELMAVPVLSPPPAPNP